MARYTLTSDEIVRSNFAACKKQLGFSFYLVPVLGLLLLSAPAIGSSSMFPFYLGLIITLAFITLPILIWWSSKRLFQQTAALHEEITVEILDDKIQFSQASGAAVIKWEDLHKWEVSSEHYYLYENQASARLLPLHSLSEEELLLLTKGLEKLG